MLKRSSETALAATRELLAPALPASLDDIQDLVELIWQRDSRVAATDRIRFESAVAEIAANIIEHSVQADPVTPVMLTVTVTCTELALRAEFSDTAADQLLRSRITIGIGRSVFVW